MIYIVLYIYDMLQIKLNHTIYLKEFIVIYKK